MPLPTLAHVDITHQFRHSFWREPRFLPKTELPRAATVSRPALASKTDLFPISGRVCGTEKGISKH